MDLSDQLALVEQCARMIEQQGNKPMQWETAEGRAFCQGLRQGHAEAAATLRREFGLPAKERT